MKILAILLLGMSLNVSARTMIACTVSEVVDASTLEAGLSVGDEVYVSSDRFQGTTAGIGETKFSQFHNKIDFKPTYGFRTAVTIEAGDLTYKIITSGQAMLKTATLYVSETEPSVEATEDTLVVAHLSCL